MWPELIVVNLDLNWDPIYYSPHLHTQRHQIHYGNSIRDTGLDTGTKRNTQHLGLNFKCSATPAVLDIGYGTDPAPRHSHSKAREFCELFADLGFLDLLDLLA